MKFELIEGTAMSARQAWHDAFFTGVRGLDINRLINNNGTHLKQCNDNYSVGLCDKGKIQQVIYNVKQESKIAWAWGMFAYAPDGTENIKSLKAILLPYVLTNTRSFDFLPSNTLSDLAELALHDACIEARTAKRKSRKKNDMAAVMCCSVEFYEKKLKPIFFKMKDSLKDLDAIALPPIANVIWLIIDKNNGDLNAAQDLQIAMKTKAANNDCLVKI